MDYQITSDTLTQGRITKRLYADSYMDAVAIMDTIVDDLDGLDPHNLDPPDKLSLDELESGRYGEYHNYCERRGKWGYILKSGWYYSGEIGDEIGHRCSAMQKLDPVYF